MKKIAAYKIDLFNKDILTQALEVAKQFQDKDFFVNCKIESNYIHIEVFKDGH